jgi:hypothetical protein
VKLGPADGVNTWDGILHHDDLVSPDNPALLRPLAIRSYFGDRPEISASRMCSGAMEESRSTW